MFDPKTGKITLISTCFRRTISCSPRTRNNTLWMSAGGPGAACSAGSTRKMFEETGDEQKAQGWTPIVLDTNGNGKRDEWTEPNQPVDPTKDKRIVGALYGIGVNPQDGTIWGTILTFPGYIVRVDPGANPSETALAEIYEPPLPGYGPRGSTSTGTASPGCRCRAATWRASTAASARCCDGPDTADRPALPGRLDALSVPRAAVGRRARHRQRGGELLHLGRPVRHVRARPQRAVATGNGNELLMALVDGKWLNFVVPYPIGFYAKWMDGRIDDPNAGWKGKGVWATYGTRTPFHIETGKGTRPKVVKFQLRPDPLAK